MKLPERVKLADQGRYITPRGTDLNIEHHWLIWWKKEYTRG